MLDKRVHERVEAHTPLSKDERLSSNYRKQVGVPAMTDRENFRRYLLGMGAEALYALSLVAFLSVAGVIIFFIFRG